MDPANTAGFAPGSSLVSLVLRACAGAMNNTLIVAIDQDIILWQWGKYDRLWSEPKPSWECDRFPSVIFRKHSFYSSDFSAWKSSLGILLADNIGVL